MHSSWKPFGKNILFSPISKEKIINGDTSKFWLYGKVLAVGNKVEAIKVGDTLGYTQWGLNKIIMDDKSEHFFVQENDDFILGIFSNE